MEHARRQDITRLTEKLKEMKDSGVYAGKRDMALTVATDLISNLSKEPKGKRYSAAARAWMGVLRAATGTAKYNIATASLGLAHESTARAWNRGDGKVVFNCQATESDFELLAQLYTGLMSTHNIEPGTVLVSFAEDETALIPKAEYDATTRTLVGFCGTKCARECVTAKECKGIGCLDGHACVANHDVLIHDGDDAYADLTKQHKRAQTGTYGRVVMIRPHDANLPPFPCLWTATCNRFTCNEYVLPQWDTLHKLWDKHLRTVVGPIIDHASDGDARRRKAMLLYSHLQGVPVALRYTLTDCEGFVFTGKFKDNRRHCLPVLYSCQDWIHNGKKIVQCFVRACMALELGPHTAHIGLLHALFGAFAPHEHGLRITDLDRIGYNAMDWDSAQRLFSQQALQCLTQLSTGQGGHARDPGLHGTLMFLRLVRRYVGMFASKRRTYVQRVQDAGFVCMCLRLWKCWVKFTPQPDVEPQDRRKLENAWVTRETFQDVLLSCHYVVLLIMAHRDYYPTRSPVFWLTGTDACEDFFSSLGSFVENKRVYTFLAALQTIRSKYWAKRTAMEHDLSTEGRRRRREKVPWDEDTPEDAWDGPGNWPTDDEMRAAWKAGLLEARAWAEECEMKPPREGAGLPAWWNAPHMHDNIEKPLGPNEDPDDGDGEDPDDAEGAGGDDDDADDDAGPGDDPGSDDDVRSVHMVDSGSDDDSVVVMNPPGFDPQDHEEAWQENAGEVLAGANELILEAGHFMNVPNKGPTHIRTILKWLTDGVANVSADRTVRVRSAGDDAGADGAADEDGAAIHHLHEDEWLVGIGDDVACKFASERGGAPTADIGRILRMRKKGKRGAYLDYSRPVNIAGDRKSLGNLYFVCCWYKKTRGRDRRTYTYNAVRMQQVHVTTIICPINLTHEPATNTYKADAEEMRVLTRSIGGAEELDIGELVR